MGLSAWLFDFLLRGFPPDGEACFHITASLMLKYGRLSIWGPQDWEGVPITQAVRAGIAGLRAGHGGGLSAWGRISRSSWVVCASPARTISPGHWLCLSGSGAVIPARRCEENELCRGACGSGARVPTPPHFSGSRACGAGGGNGAAGPST